jgi:heme/copper-type cytochrome/quinol oxidase subunit 2
MDTIPAIIIGLVIIIYGIFVYNGKLLCTLITYRARFKEETDEKYKMKVYRTYGIILTIIGTVILAIGIILFFKGIITTKNNYLY